MLKINTVTMKEEIEDILMNSYDKFGNFDEPKATKELLNLFDVINCDCCNIELTVFADVNGKKLCRECA